jgi:hypothetical protein
MTISTPPLATSQAAGPSTAQTRGRKLNPLEAIAAKKKEKELIAWVNEQYNACKNSRTQIERQWYLNLSFYFGKQYVAFLANSGLNGQVAGRLVTPPAPPWRTRLVSNRVKPIIRTELSRFISQKPNASVVPASSDDQDLFAAQAGEQIWESYYAQEKVAASFRRAAWWMAITGVGYLKCWWDDNAQDPSCPSPGKVCTAPVTPFHVFVPDLTEEDIQNQPYVLNAYTRPVEWVKNVFPDIGAVNADTKSQDEIIENAYLNLQGSAKVKPDSVLCLEMWLKAGAHKDFPKGGLITIVAGHVVNLLTDGIPYQHGKYPFIKFDHIPTGKYYSDSVIPDIIPLQREYNRTRSQLIEGKNRMGKPQLMAPKGSVDPSKITSEPGIVIEYQPGFQPPQPLPLQSIPGYVMQELDRNIMDMEDITSQHEVSKGNVPPGVTAATAISYLQEKDDSVLAHTFQSIEEGFQDLAQQVLSLAVQYWDVEHTIKVVGTDGAFDTMVLKGTDVASGTDIRMESGSALPTSKAARQAFIMDLMTKGFIDPNKGLELMEIGGVQKLYDELKIDERQAQRENLRMKAIGPDGMDQYDQQINEFRAQQQAQAVAQGPQDPTLQGQSNIPGAFPDNVGPGAVDSSQQMQPPAPQPIDPTQTNPLADAQTGAPLDPPLPVPVNTWDNHQVHIAVHNNFRKGQSFELLSDATKRLFELHVQMHQAQLAMSQGPMMGGPMGMPGPGGPPPGNLGPGPQPGGGGNQFSASDALAQLGGQGA